MELLRADAVSISENTLECNAFRFFISSFVLETRAKSYQVSLKRDQENVAFIALDVSCVNLLLCSTVSRKRFRPE